jgi:hypothetical protein
MRVFLVLGALLLPGIVSAASVYITPDEGEYGVGDTFVAEVRILTDAECVNAVDLEVIYPNRALRAVDFSKGSSILSLWVREPLLDNDRGLVSFAGGIPGGYCGRVQGDPSLSNIVGRIAFTVIGAGDETITIGKNTRLYAHDGLGTEIQPETGAAVVTLLNEPQLAENEWITEVQNDRIPPEAFDVEIHSTRGIFSGRYYLVFATTDKQSGIDHYELYERGAWRTITSPHALRFSSRDDIQVRAIDKAGNERIGSYDASSVPESQAESDFSFIIFVVVLLALIAFSRFYLRRSEEPVPPAPSA